MDTLPEELLCYLSSFLNGRECINLSHTCSRFLTLFQDEHFWKQMLLKENILQEKDILSLAGSLASQRDGGRCEAKWSYILHYRLRQNWRKGNFKTTSIPLGNGSVVGHDDKHLVIWEPRPDNTSWDVSLYRIDGKGAILVTNRLGWTTERISSSHGLGSILVSKGVALLSFFDNDSSQEIVAVDLEDLCERWRYQSDLTRLFGTDIYAFDFSSYTVNICDIRSQARIYSVSLPFDVRLPQGQISGDGRHLAIPGKMVIDNSPVVSSTNVRTGTYKLLFPSTPVCPYRWFEKTEVSKGKVYGLLNRRTLFVWDSEVGDCLRRLDISESPPGMGESNLIWNFLTVGFGIVATIHVDSSCVNLFKTEDDTRPPLDPINMRQLMGVPVKVSDVFINGSCLLVRTANCQIPQFYISIFPLPLRDDIKDSLAESRLINLVPVEDCSLLDFSVTASKMLNFAEGQLRLYDFM